MEVVGPHRVGHAELAERVAKVPDVAADISDHCYSPHESALTSAFDVDGSDRGGHGTRVSPPTNVPVTECWPIDGPLIGPGRRRSSIASAGEW